MGKALLGTFSNALKNINLALRGHDFVTFLYPLSSKILILVAQVSTMHCGFKQS